MKPFAHETIGNAKGLECAGEVLEVFPLIVGALRSGMRAGGAPQDGSMPQLRILGCLSMNGDQTLSSLADEMGLQRPTTSKMVDALVRRGWIQRRTDGADRRRIRLGLTRSGKNRMTALHDRMRGGLAASLEPMSAADRRTVILAMRILRETLSPAPAAAPRRSNA